MPLKVTLPPIPGAVWLWVPLMYINNFAILCFGLRPNLVLEVGLPVGVRFRNRRVFIVQNNTMLDAVTI